MLCPEILKLISLRNMGKESGGATEEVPGGTRADDCAQGIVVLSLTSYFKSDNLIYEII